jgi:hypothetical protein
MRATQLREGVSIRSPTSGPRRVHASAPDAVPLADVSLLDLVFARARRPPLAIRRSAPPTQPRIPARNARFFTCDCRGLARLGLSAGGRWIRTLGPPSGQHFFQRPSQNPATTNQPNSQNRILTIDKASFVAQRPRLDLVAARGGTPNHRRDHEPFEQRDGCRGADNDGLHRRATQSFAGAFLLPASCWSSASSPTSSSSSSAGWRRSRIRRPR